MVGGGTWQRCMAMGKGLGDADVTIETDEDAVHESVRASTSS